MTTNRAEKLKQLCELEGQTEEDMLRAATFDSVAASICINEHCDYTTRMEPDQDKGWCEECSDNTVVSCLILAEII